MKRLFFLSALFASCLFASSMESLGAPKGVKATQSPQKSTNSFRQKRKVDRKKSPKSESFFFLVDPRGTYTITRRDNPSAPSYLSLRGLGVGALDFITLTRVGAYNNGGRNAPENSNGLVAMFITAQGQFLPPGPESEVFTAITPPTLYDGIPTDVAGDFVVGVNSLVQVPSGAVGLIFTTGDAFYGDNFDTNQNFGVLVEAEANEILLDIPELDFLSGRVKSFQILAEEEGATSFTFEKLTNEDGGTVTVTPQGLVTFQPDSNFWGESSVTIEVTSNLGTTLETTIPLSVERDACPSGSNSNNGKDSDDQTCGNGPVQNPLNQPTNSGSCTVKNPAPSSCTSVENPVNVANGAMWHEVEDFSLPLRRPDIDLSFRRTYVAFSGSPSGDLGPNWKHNFESRLLIPTSSGGSIVWIDPSGGPWTFEYQGIYTSYKAPAALDATLWKLSDKYLLQFKDKRFYEFSLSGKMISYQTAHGEGYFLTYDSNNRLASITNSFAGELIFSRNSSGKISKIYRTRDRMSYHYYYDSAGRLIKVVDDQGRAQSYEYNSDQVGTFAEGLLTKMVDALGRETVFTYYDDGRAKEQFEPENGRVQFYYAGDAGNNSSTTVIDSDGVQTTYFFDENLRTIREVKENGATKEIEWNSRGYRSAMRDELGFVTSYTYDPKGNVETLKRPTDSLPRFFQYDQDYSKLIGIYPLQSAATTFSLNPNNGDVMSEVRGDYSLQYTRDVFGNILSTNNGRATFSDARDANGFLVYKFDAHNPETRQVDERGRVKKITFATGRVQEFTYDKYDLVLSVVDSDGPDSYFTYDVVNRLVKKVVTDGSEKQITEYEWDGQDRLLSEKDALGRVTRYVYDPNRTHSRPIEVIDPAGKITRHEYDALNRKVKTIDARGAETRFAYNLRNELVSVTDANGNITRYEYDGVGRKVKEIRPSVAGNEEREREIRYFYDEEDRLIKEEHVSVRGASFNRAIEFQYDPYDRMTKKVLKVGDTVQEEANMAYEDQMDADLLKLVNNSKVNLGFTANASPPYSLNAFSVETAVGGNPLGILEDQFSISRNSTGEISSIVGTNRGTIYTKSYDRAGRLTGVNALALKTAMAYDGFGRKSKVSHSDGTTGSIGYDPINRIVNLRWQEKGSDSVFQTLAYDLAGNVKHMVREHGSYALAYDEADQLIESNYQGKLKDQSGSWQYDLLGNRLRDSKNGLSRQTANFLLQNERSNFFSDEDGFGETARESTKDGEKLYSYRADGKIAGFIGNGVHAIYHYDGLDRLVAKEIKTKTETFVQSFMHLGQETRVLLGKAGNGEVTTYIDGQGMAERLGEVRGTIGKGYITDHLGSVLNSDAAGGSKSFGLWGEISNVPKITSSSKPVSYGFTGHVIDLESGLNRTEYRQYDAKVGRWLRQDPIGFLSGDINYYRYVLDNPLKYKDTNGLWGFGGTGGGSLEIGMGESGSGGTASAGWVAFDTFTGGAFGSYGSSTNCSKSNVFGAYAGVGAGLFFTNASYLSQLQGPAKTTSINTPVGSIQWSTAGDIFSFGLTLGPGAGFSFSQYTTNTEVKYPQ